MRPEQIKLRSFAKVNLGLHILGAREDGFHEIRTLFQTIGLHDTLEIRLTQGQGVSCQCNWAELNSADNLVVRAMEAVCRHAGLKGGGGGSTGKEDSPWAPALAGGSSNAAAAVMGVGPSARLADVPAGLVRDRRSFGIGRSLLLPGWTGARSGARLGGLPAGRRTALPCPDRCSLPADADRRGLPEGQFAVDKPGEQK